MYFDLFLTFAKIGAVTFGGGLAMLPILEREICDKKNWAVKEELLDYYAIGQCTPGIIAINTATFIGRKMAGMPGAIFATLGMVFPSLVIITTIAALISNFSSIEAVSHAFVGIRICVCVLIFNSVLKLWRSAVKDKITLLLCLTVAFLSLFLDLNPIVYVLSCAVIGIIVKSITAGSDKEKENK